VQSTAPSNSEYLPAWQSLQAADPVVGLYIPAAHAEHESPGPVYPALQKQLALPAFESAFDSQAAQPTAAASTAYVPATQSTQAAEPKAALKVPDWHGEHWPLDPVYPASQAHSVLPASEFEFIAHSWQAKDAVAAAYVPATQSTQAADPEAALNFPEAHAAHEAAGPLKPGSHTHLVLPAALLELASHASHSTLAEAAEKLPASHAMHASEPPDDLYVPSAHAVHESADPVYPYIYIHTHTCAISESHLQMYVYM
jgi:hypothetical protein